MKLSGLSIIELKPYGNNSYQAIDSPESGIIASSMLGGGGGSLTITLKHLKSGQADSLISLDEFTDRIFRLGCVCQPLPVESE